MYDKTYNYILYMFLIFLVVNIIMNIIYVSLTQFEKTIIVKEKHTYGSRGSKGNQRISDQHGNIYTVVNSIYMLHFTSAELFNKLEEDKTYTIRGYGMRIPFLSMFPNIVKIVK
jgi:hypothetical protein